MLKHTIVFAAVAGLVLALAPAAQAAPSEPFHWVFVTSMARDALDTDIAQYDAFVQAAADAGSETGPLQLTWKAIASTDDVDAKDHVNVQGAIYLLDETLIADDAAHLWGTDPDGTSVQLHAAITRDENGDDYGLGYNPVWTGTNADGLKADGTFEGGTDNGWPLGSANKDPMHGDIGAWYPQLNGHWIAEWKESADTQLPLYAISELIFEPPTLVWKTDFTGDWDTDNWTPDGGANWVAPSGGENMTVDSATGRVDVDADLTAKPAGSLAIGGTAGGMVDIGGAGTLVVTGGVNIGASGTMLVNGALTAGGGVTVASGGTLGGSGSITGAVTVDSGGTVAPGASIGTLGVTGNVALGGSYAVEVSGSGAPVAGTNNDSLAVTGDVTIGTMGVDLVWLVGDKIGGDGDGKFGGEYTIVTGTTVAGSPANVTVNSFVAKFPDGSTVDLWDSYYHDVTGPSGPSDVLVSVGPADPFTDRVTVTLPQVLRGDSTLDGRVMMNDALPIILNWQKDVPVGTGWELGNFNFDDKIMMNDALEIVLSWGQKTDADPPGPNPAGAVEAAAVADRATAVYDAATGFVWLEVNSALAYLQIIDPNSSGELGPKDPDGTKPFVGFHPLMAAALLEDERPHHVGEMNFGGLPQTAGPHLYVEATPGIPAGDFDFVLYTAALDWTDATVDVVWTPEPATMTLLLMGGALVMARRRRRK